MHLTSLVKTGFELVAEGHELVDFGDDSVLFCEGGKRDYCLFNFSKIEIWLGSPCREHAKVVIALNKEVLHITSVRLVWIK